MAYRHIDFALKNDELFPMAFDILVQSIRFWRTNISLAMKYDMERILYDFITSNDNYRFCLMAI